MFESEKKWHYSCKSPILLLALYKDNNTWNKDNNTFDCCWCLYS